MRTLTEAHKRTCHSLAKTINSLHKRNWIDDDKREHYRRIIKAMVVDEDSYNQETVDRLKKKLDRVKKKMGGTERDDKAENSCDIESSSSANKDGNDFLSTAEITRQIPRNGGQGKPASGQKSTPAKGRQMNDNEIPKHQKHKELSSLAEKKSRTKSMPSDETKLHFMNSKETAVASFTQQQAESKSTSKTPLESMKNISKRPTSDDSGKNSRPPTVPKLYKSTKNGNQERKHRNSDKSTILSPLTPMLNQNNPQSNIIRRERSAIAYPTPLAPRNTGESIKDRNEKENNTDANDLQTKSLQTKQASMQHPTQLSSTQKDTNIINGRSPYNNGVTDIQQTPSTNKVAGKGHQSMVQKANQQEIAQNSLHKFNSALVRIIDPKKDKNAIPRSSIKTLFVEMCVFGRMGFVQPPSCLRCTMSKNCNPHCQNLVVWRRNADDDHTFHPKNLDGNLLFVTCFVAQSWITGETVEGQKWDAKRKVLLEENN